MTYGTNSGYMMSVFLDEQAGSGSSNNSGTQTAGIIKRTSVNVRSSPSINAGILAVVNTGDKMMYYAGESYSGDGYSWHRCTSSFGAGNGYIATNYVQNDTGSGTTPPNSNYPILATIDSSKHGTGTSVNIRSNPWGMAGRVGSVGQNQPVSVNSTTGTWIRVKYGNITGYVMAKYVRGTIAYNRSKNETAAVGAGGTYYIGNRYLAEYSSEMTANAKYIYNYFRARDWIKNAICAMLGNMQVESKLNPGLWQSKKENNDLNGFGLTQWTKAKDKILQYAYDKAKQIDDLDMQLMRITEEMSGQHDQWFSSMSGYQYSQSTKDVGALVEIFCKGYERPKSPDYKARKNHASHWEKIL